MNNATPEPCCTRFNPTPWDNQTVTWNNRTFLQDRIRSFLHIPLNFGAVMKRNMQAIDAAGAEAENGVVLCDENSLWGADLYIEVTRAVPGKKMTAISGTFLSSVFEGPYQNMRRWIAEVKARVAAKTFGLQKLYFYYTTCPRCAKTYGKNYIVILAQIH